MLWTRKCKVVTCKPEKPAESSVSVLLSPRSCPQKWWPPLSSNEKRWIFLTLPLNKHGRRHPPMKSDEAHGQKRALVCVVNKAIRDELDTILFDCWRFFLLWNVKMSYTIDPSIVEQQEESNVNFIYENSQQIGCRIAMLTRLRRNVQSRHARVEDTSS